MFFQHWTWYGVSIAKACYVSKLALFFIFSFLYIYGVSACSLSAMDVMHLKGKSGISGYARQCARRDFMLRQPPVCHVNVVSFGFFCFREGIRLHSSFQGQLSKHVLCVLWSSDSTLGSNYISRSDSSGRQRLGLKTFSRDNRGGGGGDINICPREWRQRRRPWSWLVVIVVAVVAVVVVVLCL